MECLSYQWMLDARTHSLCRKEFRLAASHFGTLCSGREHYRGCDMGHGRVLAARGYTQVQPVPMPPSMRLYWTRPSCMRALPRTQASTTDTTMKRILLTKA